MKARVAKIRAGDTAEPEASKQSAGLERTPGNYAKAAASGFAQQTKDLLGGAVRGAGSIGATLLAPLDAAARAVNGGKPISVGGYDVLGQERRDQMTDATRELGANPDSMTYGAAKLVTEIAGTAGVGPAMALAVPARVATAMPGIVNALQSAGMTTGGRAPGALNLLNDLSTRSLAGGLVGGASTGLIDPENFDKGAMWGAVLPPGLTAAGAVGNGVGAGAKAVGRAIFGKVSPEVVALAKRAKELGIDIPADRLVSSKPLDAVASGLNYIPFSGRSATEAKMAEQLNRAGSRLMGQDTPNMNQALRKAGDVLGAKFDATLKNNGVAVDKQLLEDATAIVNRAREELGDDAFRAIDSKFRQLMDKGADGVIDGQAAYVIKRDLDRIGRGNSPNAWHASSVKEQHQVRS